MVCEQAAILAAAVIGSFSWEPSSDAYWLAPAFWYCSLVLSILAIILSTQQIAVLDLLTARRGKGTPISSNAEIRSYLPLMLTQINRNEREMGIENDDLGTWKPRWKMVFTWQCPTMFLAYSVLFFLGGLTLFVCTPLIRRKPWGADSNVRSTATGISNNRSGKKSANESIDCNYIPHNRCSRGQYIHFLFVLDIPLY